MLLLRVVLLWALVCLHVIGGAVLFRKYFPRESAWWGFFLPSLAFVSLINFIEYFVALPNLAWMLPFTSFGVIWISLQKGISWKGMFLPSALFIVSFTYSLWIRCVQPDVNFYCTEGLTDLTRILDFSLGDKLPATDSWLPPYPHVGYYSFMQYGASVLKRVLSIDIGTTYNLAFALVNGLTLLASAAAAYSLSRFRAWVAVLTLLMVAGAFTGSTPFYALSNLQDPNPTASIDIGGGDDPAHHQFDFIQQRLPTPQIGFRLYIPGCYVYYSEFHATQGGHLLALLTVFAAAEVLRRKHSLTPWIYLLIAPTLAILTCTWFFLIIVLIAGPTFIVAWLAGRRPTRWQYVFAGTAAGMALLWPSLSAFVRGSAAQKLYLALDWTHDYSTILIQWWPIYIPWLALSFTWPRLNLAAKWLHLSMLPIFIIINDIFFTDRGTTLEKTWSGVFGIGVVILFPILFSQKGWFFRAVSLLIACSGFISLYAWFIGSYRATDWSSNSFLHIEGDSFIQNTPQLNRMKEVLSRLHGQTVLTGISRTAFFEGPCLPAFTENRCFLGWTNAEETTGHPAEAHERERQTNSFYAGTMADPHAFLNSRNITAVLIWPEDKIPDQVLEKLKAQLEPDYTYYDCKQFDLAYTPDPNQQLDNAGVFIKKSAETKPATPP